MHCAINSIRAQKTETPYDRAASDLMASYNAELQKLQKLHFQFSVPEVGVIFSNRFRIFPVYATSGTIQQVDISKDMINDVHSLLIVVIIFVLSFPLLILDNWMRFGTEGIVDELVAVAVDVLCGSSARIVGDSSAEHLPVVVGTGGAFVVGKEAECLLLHLVGTACDGLDIGADIVVVIAVAVETAP